jgi:flagellar biosynthesis anti-sigma factor FlgM
LLVEGTMKIHADKNETVKQDAVSHPPVHPKQNEQPKTSGGFAPEDRVELSTEALDLKKMTEAVKQMPDVRQDVVNSTKEKLSQGTYRVSSGTIARRMMEEETVDKVV